MPVSSGLGPTLPRVVNFDTGMPMVLPFVNVLDFGADPTGTTSSTTAFNAAVAAASAQGGPVTPGGRIIIPPGQYLLNPGVTIAHSNIMVYGAGSSSLILNGTTNSFAIQFGDGTTIYNRCGIRDCSFAQASGVTPVSGNIGLSLVKETNFFLSNIQVFNFPAALQRGIQCVTVSQSFFDAMGVQSCLETGIVFSGCTDLYLTSSRSDANGSTGWGITDSAGLYVESCSAFGNTSVGWNLFATSGHNKNFFFRNAVSDTSGSYNWQISDLTASSFTNIWGSTQQSSAVNTFANGVILLSSAVHDISFIGGTTLNNNSSGVFLNNSGGMPTNIQFVGFNFGVSGQGNGVSGTGYGLQVDNAASVITVTGGQSFGNATAPVNIAGTTPTMNILQLKGWSNVPTLAWNFDAEDAKVTVTTGGNAILATGSGLISITDTSFDGSTGLYLLGGGNITFIGQSKAGGSWVASTLTPGAGTQSVGWDPGSSVYRIENNTGVTVTYGIFMAKGRNAD